MSGRVGIGDGATAIGFGLVGTGVLQLIGTMTLVGVMTFTGTMGIGPSAMKPLTAGFTGTMVTDKC